MAEDVKKEEVVTPKEEVKTEEPKVKEPEVKEPKEEVKKSKKKFFVTDIAGLTFYLGDTTVKEPDLLTSVSFQPVRVMFQGDIIRKGVLAAEDKELLERLENDHNVFEITEKEYDEYLLPLE